jgi:hypothetical protein
MSVEVAGEVQLKEGHLHRATRSTGQADDLVDRYGRRAEQFLDKPERAGIAVHPSRHSGFVGGAGRCEARLDRPNRLQHVRRVLDQSCALPDQLVAALGSRIAAGDSKRAISWR